jgi:hypothetical protein
LPESPIRIAGRPGLILLHIPGKTYLYPDFQFDNSDIALRPSGPDLKVMDPPSFWRTDSSKLKE